MDNEAKCFGVFSSLLRGVRGEGEISSESTPWGLSSPPTLRLRTSSSAGDFTPSVPDVMLMNCPLSSSSLSLKSSEYSESSCSERGGGGGGISISLGGKGGGVEIWAGRGGGGDDGGGECGGGEVGGGGVEEVCRGEVVVGGVWEGGGGVKGGRL